jgi:hypothetical protein
MTENELKDKLITDIKQVIVRRDISDKGKVLSIANKLIVYDKAIDEIKSKEKGK